MHFDIRKFIHVLEHLFHNRKQSSNFGYELWIEALRHSEVVHIQQHL